MGRLNNRDMELLRSTFQRGLRTVMPLGAVPESPMWRATPGHVLVRVIGDRQPTGYYLGIITGFIGQSQGETTGVFQDELDAPVWVRTIGYQNLVVGEPGSTGGRGVYWARIQDLVEIQDQLDTGTGADILPLALVDDTGSHGTGTGTLRPGYNPCGDSTGFYIYYNRCEEAQIDTGSGTGTGSGSGTGTGTGTGGTVGSPCGTLSKDLLISFTGCTCMEDLGTLAFVWTEGFTIGLNPPTDGWYLEVTGCDGKLIKIGMYPCTDPLGDCADVTEGFLMNGQFGSGGSGGSSSAQPGCVIDIDSPSLTFNMDVIFSDIPCVSVTAHVFK